MDIDDLITTKLKRFFLEYDTNGIRGYGRKGYFSAWGPIFSYNKNTVVSGWIAYSVFPQI